MIVLILINDNPHLTAREIASSLQITERTVLRVIGDLESGGYIKRRKEGRANHYELNPDQLIEHPLLKAVPASELLRVLLPENTAE